MVNRLILTGCLLGYCASLIAQSPSPASRQAPPTRDTSAQQRDAAPAPGGAISGRVVAADTGRPLKYARVAVQAVELPGGRASQTDESGVFQLNELPAGRYTLTVSKTGFISLSYGQRRPLQAGTPLQLADGQQLKDVDFRLPRGGAIAGRVYDEDGEPLPGAIVRVLRYQYMQGERRLVPVDAGQSDDKGAYRVWGLLPADYYVSATARPAAGGRGGFGGGLAGAVMAGRGGFGGFAGRNDQEPVMYAPTYFPGVGSVNEAKPVTVGISQEVLDVSFSLQLVRTSRVSGRVVNPDATPVTAGVVTLTPEGSGGGGGRPQLGVNYTGRIQWDGAFAMANVPPGRYSLRARGTDDVAPQYAEQPLTVGGGDVADITLILAPGATITGTVSFLATRQPLPNDVTQVRVVAPSADPNGFAANPNAKVDGSGQFTLTGVPAGPHFIRANGAGRGWALKSVTVNGRDVIDAPIELRSGQTLANVALQFTDQLSQIAGTVTSEQGSPVVDYTVLAFPTDERLWRAQSRQIMTARPDQNGKYQINGLPPGEYYMAIVDPAEQEEWFEPTFLDQHRAGSVKLTISDGDVKTQDFRIASR